jgi:voltage-gated potassium channel
MTDLDIAAKERLLAGLSFFSGCTARELRDIAHLAEEKSFAVGAELCRQGAFENEVFVIVEGQADVLIDGSSVGNTRIGEIVGELAMLGNGRRAATLRAIQPTKVLALDPREVDSVLAADPSSANRLSDHRQSSSVED